MTIKDNFYKQVCQIKGIKIIKDAQVQEDTNLKIKAVFAFKIEIYTYSCLKKLFSLINKYNFKYYILGKGSNVLFAKDYYEAILLKLMPIESKNLMVANGGEALSYLNNKYIKKGIESFNFLTGVPCSVAGAIVMNAGCFNKSISEIIEYVYAFDLKKLKYKVFTNKECKFAYRHSYFTKHHNYFIIGAKIKLIYNDKEQILLEHHHYLNSRFASLPLQYPNLGSIFKNPKPLFAAKLIEEAGLKGLSIGGAKISEKHANVIINYQNATYKDILKLIRIIKKKIYQEYQINLELEIIIFK